MHSKNCRLFSDTILYIFILRHTELLLSLVFCTFAGNKRVNVPGIMVTTQKRQEFQMQLMKRARRRAQKKIEYLEDDKNWKEVKHLRLLFFFSVA